MLRAPGILVLSMIGPYVTVVLAIHLLAVRFDHRTAMVALVAGGKEQNPVFGGNPAFRVTTPFLRCAPPGARRRGTRVPVLQRFTGRWRTGSSVLDADTPPAKAVSLLVLLVLAVSGHEYVASLSNVSFARTGYECRFGQ